MSPAIDSPNPKVLETASAVHKRTPIINSISLEKERCENLMAIIAETDLIVITLCMSDERMAKPWMTG
jgi:5-methyltetrahydrofolate--homocysteine methyltransferase